MVPSGWSYGRIDEFFVLQRGYDLTSKNRVEGSIPVYSSSGLAYYHNEAKVAAPGVVTGRKGSVGQVFLIEEDFWPHDTTLWVKDFKNNDPKFITYFLKAQKLERFDEASSVPTLNRNNVHRVKTAFPPLGEQRGIVKVLSTWDKAISTTEKLIETSKQQKKALMQQLLTGKKRLVNPETGKMFQGEWKFSLFNELYKVANRKDTQVKSGDYLESGKTPIVDQGKSTIGGYTNNDLVYQDLPVIVFGDHTRVVKWVDFEFAQGADGTQVLKSNQLMDDKFAYYVLLNTDIPNLGYSRHMRELKERDFKYPKLKCEQQRIASVLTSADKEIEVLEAKLAHFKQEKKALMQQLLTGKRRVVVDAA